MSLTAHNPIPITTYQRLPEVAAAFSAVECDFPSPAQDYEHDSLDLNHFLIRDQVSTFILRVSGHSMLDAGNSEGDRLIVDRGVEPRHNDIVVAVIDGQLTVKRFISTQTRRALAPDNPAYRELYLTPEMDVRIFGVALTCLHVLRGWNGR